MPDDANACRNRKDSQLVIRIGKSERDSFVALCDALDTSAAREIRRFIRAFTLDHAEPAAPGGAADIPARPEADKKRKKRDKHARRK